MLDRLRTRPPDPLLGLLHLVAVDARPTKLDLGVGIYRDRRGLTPVPKAVKLAEQALIDRQATKAYVGPRGDETFLALLGALVLGDTSRPLASVQTPGGTGALRMAAELLRSAGAERVLVGRPAWANHEPIFGAAGLRSAPYRYFDPVRQVIDAEALTGAVAAAPSGTAVLLQASCHNPTGADLDTELWTRVADLCAERRLLPVVDVAYQGFGRGLADDVAGLQTLATRVPELLVAVSCSKTFGLYRERTGALFALCPSPGAARAVESQMLDVARAAYSMPPDHGAAVVRLILETPAWRRAWRTELRQCRDRLRSLRRQLADRGGALGLKTAALATQQGMFSQLPLTSEQVARLRDRYAIYVAPSGRINIAGLAPHSIELVASALLQSRIAMTVQQAQGGTP